MARRLDDHAGLIRVALSFDRGFFANLGRADESRVTLLREALSSASDSPNVRACLLALLASELTWDDPGDTRFAMSDEALELARHTEDSATLLRVLSLRPPTIWSLDTHDEVVASVDELGSRTWGGDDLVLKGRYLTFRFGAAAESGKFRDLPDVVENLGEVGRFMRLPVALWHATLLHATSPCSTASCPRRATSRSRASSGGNEPGSPKRSSSGPRSSWRCAASPAGSTR